MKIKEWWRSLDRIEKFGVIFGWPVALPIAFIILVIIGTGKAVVPFLDLFFNP